jgi:hypothetical protein
MVKPKHDSSDDETTIAMCQFDKTSRFLDNQYGIRREGDTVITGNSIVNVNESNDNTIDGKRFKGTKGLWEILTRKNVNTHVVTTSDIKRYKQVLEITNAHLTGCEPGGTIVLSRCEIYEDNFQTVSTRGNTVSLDEVLKQATLEMSKNLYFDPTKPTGFSTVRKLTAASPRGKKPADIQAWLFNQLPTRYIGQYVYIFLGIRMTSRR